MTLRSAILALLLCAAHAQARTLYVSLTGSHDTNAPAFSTWATAATNIQAAIDAASGGDTIRIAHGTYTIDAAATNTAMCYVNKPLSIIGGRGTLFDADKTILNANGNSRVMSVGVASDPSVLRGVTLTGATAALAQDRLGQPLRASALVQAELESHALEALAAGTPALSGTEPVSSPEPALTSRPSEWP